MMEDVVVVGAGPVGLLLAGELVLGGVQPLVVEASADAGRRTRSFGQRSVNGRSGHTLALRGLLPALAATQSAWINQLEQAGQQTTSSDQISTVLKMMREGRAGGHFGGLPLEANLDDGRCYLMKQHMLEKVLADWARDLGVRVQTNTEVVAVRDESTFAVVEFTDGRSLDTRYVVGCDGGRSVVRKTAGFTFLGTTPTMTGRVAMAELSDQDTPTAVLRGPHGLVNSLMVPGEVTTVEFDGTGPADRDAPMTAAELQGSMLRAGGLRATVNQLHSGTRFSDNTRQADTYRRGRVLLAGDAAHVHSPIGGQGLNLGLQDAANLGWKLALLVTGRGPETLLDSYTAERHPAAATVLRSTRAQVALMRPGPQVDALRDILAEVITIPAAHAYFGALVSGADLDYAPDSTHPLVGRFLPSDLMPEATSHMNDGHFLLIDFIGDERFSQAVSGNDRVRIIRYPNNTSDASALLIRPDGYVAWAGELADTISLNDTLDQYFCAT
jgi:2-polyprenyl-6-methoxyphenol hydroxylase-like FAD-dependent oxidoreductase